MAGVHPDLTELVTRRLAELGDASGPLSIRAASRRAKAHGYTLSHETIRQIARGQHSGDLSDETVLGLSSAFEVSRAEAELLNLRQRRVLEELIRVMVEVDRVQAGAAGDSSRRASLMSLSPAVSTAQISLTPAVEARVARLGELVEHTPQLLDEFLAQSDELLRRYEDRGTQSSETG